MVAHFPDAVYVEATMLKSLINESEDVWYLRKKGASRSECVGQMHLVQTLTMDQETFQSRHRRYDCARF